MTDEQPRQRATERHREVEQPPAQWQGLFRKRHPLALLYTGNGKGKTSSALGVTIDRKSTRLNSSH